MESDRFGKFILAVEGIHKAVQKIKLSEAPRFGLKGVHLFWMYELYTNPDGLAASELAERSNINRSLVSREIEALKENGYVTTANSGKRGYNAKIVLTQHGKETAKRIKALALDFQNRTSIDIPEGELKAFYSTLDKIYSNLSTIAYSDDNDISNKPLHIENNQNENINAATAAGGNI